jgi:16S rRNA (guanine527-N7)-methyltransferase
MENDVDKLDIHLAHLTDAARDQFRLMYDALLQFNSKLQLVPSSRLKLSAVFQFIDCVRGLELIQREIPFTNQPIYDLGSGNGLPGLVLAITRPELSVLLVERDLRKAEFLNYLIGQLQVKNSRVLSQSIDSLDKGVVTTGLIRNVGTLASVTIQLTSVFAPGGQLFHFKGSNWASEIASCPTQIFTKWTMDLLGEYPLPDVSETRSVVSSSRLE